MSWGERSCKYLSDENRPCSPTLATCNPQCSYYKNNGRHPDWMLDKQKPEPEKSFVRHKPTKKQIKKLKRKGKLK